MRLGLGVAHGDQPLRHGYGGVRSVGAFIVFGEVSKKVLCALKDVKDFICKWYPSLQVVSKLASGSACGFASACDRVFYFCPDYGLLLELHALTQVARSYALLLWLIIGHNIVHVVK